MSVNLQTLFLIIGLIATVASARDDNCKILGNGAMFCTGEWSDPNLWSRDDNSFNSICPTGYHACGIDGDITEIRTYISASDCHSIDGKYVAAIPHAIPNYQRNCNANPPAQAWVEFGCPQNGWGSSPLCCGTGCSHKPPSCPGHALDDGNTWCECNWWYGCGNFPSSRADGALCCPDSGRGMQLIRNVCDFPSFRHVNLNEVGSVGYTCAQIRMGNGLSIENARITANVVQRTLTVSGRVWLRRISGNPRFDVTATYASGSWTLTSTLSSPIRINNMFRITGGELSVNSRQDLSLGLELEVQFDGKTSKNTVSISRQGNGDLTISGSVPSSAIPKFCIGNNCMSWPSISVTITRENNAWSGGMTLTKEIGRTTITGTLSASSNSRELTCTITPKSGGGGISDFVQAITGSRLRINGAPASISTNLVNNIKLVSLSFAASSDPNAEKSISGTVNAFGIQVDGLLKLKGRSSLFLVSLTKRSQPNLSLKVGRAELRWRDIAGLVQNDDKIVVAFASDSNIGRDIRDIGVQSLAEPMHVSRGFSFKMVLTTSKPSGRDERNAVAKFIGDKMRINQVIISFGVENNNKIKLEVGISGRVDIWKLRLSDFNFYIKKGLGSIELGMGVSVEARLGRDGDNSNLALAGTFGLQTSGSGMGISASLTQLRDWNNAFNINGLTLKNVHVSGSVDVLPVIKPKSLALSGMVRLSTGVQAGASCVIISEPSPLFYIGIAARDWKMIDIVNWRLPDLPGKQMFDGIRFGSFDFEMAMAFGGSFSPATVRKPDGSSRALVGPMLYMDAKDFRFGRISGQRMMFDLGFGSHAGITVDMNINRLNFGPFTVGRRCNQLHHGPRFYLNARRRQSFRMNVEGAVRGCVAGACACMGVNFSFESNRIRGCVDIKISDGINYQCDWRCRNKCRRHWGVRICTPECRFHRTCNDGAIKFRECATINLPNRRRLESGFDPIPEELEPSQNWKMGKDLERAPRKIRLSRSCVEFEPTEEARVYNEVSKGDCAELCVFDESCTGIVFGKRRCYLVKETLDISSNVPIKSQCAFNEYKVDTFDNDKHFVAVEDGVNVYGSHGELDEIKHLVRCISDEVISGWKANKCGGVSEVDRWGVCEYRTWSEADAFCREEGARLPTRAEVEAGCVSRAGFCSDTEPVWTSDNAATTPTYTRSVPEGARSMDNGDFVYTLHKGVARCELESQPISTLEECKDALNSLGLPVEREGTIDSPLSPCGCHYDEKLKHVTFNEYQDPCGCWGTKHSECPDLKTPPYANMRRQDEIAVERQTQPVCKRNLQEDMNRVPTQTANLYNFLEKHFASGLAEAGEKLILGGERDHELFGADPFAKPDTAVFKEVDSAFEYGAKFIAREYGVDRDVAIKAMLYYEKEVEMGSLMKHLDTLVGMCIEHQPYCFAMSLIQSELVASSNQFRALEAQLEEAGILSLDSSKKSVPQMFAERGVDRKLMHKYQQAKADFAAYNAVQIAKELSRKGFSSMKNALEQDPRVILTQLRTVDMNFMDMDRTQTLALQGDGYFFGRPNKMDFDILLPIQGTNSGEMILDELRRDLHTEFMVDEVDGENGVDCEELQSTRRLLMEDLIEESKLNFEKFVETASSSEDSVRSVKQILACVRHPTTRTTKTSGSKYLVWDVMESDWAVAAQSNGLWHEGQEMMQHPLVSEQDHERIMRAHSEEQLSNNDACSGLNAKANGGRCCEGFVEKNGICVKHCTSYKDSPDEDGFFVPCCDGLLLVDILSKKVRKGEMRCVKPKDTCFGFGEAYTREVPCCEGLVPGALDGQERVCVRPNDALKALSANLKKQPRLVALAQLG